MRFDDLKGESDLVAQRMLKGFYLSLDRKVDARSGLFWHTTSGFFAPKDHLIVHDPKTEFDGIVLDVARPRSASCRSRSWSARRRAPARLDRRQQGA